MLFFSIQIVVPPLPPKAWGRQLPFRKDDGIFDEDFVEERRKGLEAFVNKYDALSNEQSMLASILQGITICIMRNDQALLIILDKTLI